MKINLFFLILLILFTSIYSQKYCNYSIHPIKSSDCHNKLSENEINLGIQYCCYLIIDDNITCQGLTQEEYEEIPLNKIIAHDNSFYYVIDCFSKYISLGLMQLIYFLFL